MTEDFNLSERLSDCPCSQYSCDYKWVSEKDVKEFIKRLNTEIKEEADRQYRKFHNDWDMVYKIINKLAGSKLTEKGDGDKK